MFVACVVVIAADVVLFVVDDGMPLLLMFCMWLLMLLNQCLYSWAVSWTFTLDIVDPGVVDVVVSVADVVSFTVVVVPSLLVVPVSWTVTIDMLDIGLDADASVVVDDFVASVVEVVSSRVLVLPQYL